MSRGICATTYNTSLCSRIGSIISYILDYKPKPIIIKVENGHFETTKVTPMNNPAYTYNDISSQTLVRCQVMALLLLPRLGKELLALAVWP